MIISFTMELVRIKYNDYEISTDYYGVSKSTMIIDLETYMIFFKSN